MTSTKLKLYCRKTKQPVTMAVTDVCPHCGQIGHGADLTGLKREIDRLLTPRPTDTREAIDGP